MLLIIIRWYFKCYTLYGTRSWVFQYRNIIMDWLILCESFCFQHVCTNSRILNSSRQKFRYCFLFHCTERFVIKIESPNIRSSFEHNNLSAFEVILIKQMLNISPDSFHDTETKWKTHFFLIKQTHLYANKHEQPTAVRRATEAFHKFF